MKGMGADPKYKVRCFEDLKHEAVTHIEHRELGQDGVELLLK
jgi:hypothetical protein